jgi:hypothetical protein
LSGRPYWIRVRRYPIEAAVEPALESCFEPLNPLLLQMPRIVGFIKRKLLEDGELADTVRLFDELNRRGWLRADAEFYDIEVYLTKEEWREVVRMAVDELRSCLAALEEHLRRLEEA